MTSLQTASTVWNESGAVTGTRTRAGGTTTHRANRYTITAVCRTRGHSLFINSTGAPGDLRDQRIEAVPSIVVCHGDCY